MRNTATPMYEWIRQHGSVLNLHDNSRLMHRPYGRELVEDVLIRYVRLHKSVPTSKVSDMIGRLVDRYGTKYHFLPEEVSFFLHNQHPRDMVSVEKNGTRYVLTSKYLTKHKRECERRRELLDYGAELKRAEALRIEREAELSHALAMAEATKPKLKIVNRLTKKLIDNYVNIQSQNIPDCLADVPGIHDIPVAHPPGVYILMQGETIVYVGQSINPSTRIGQHSKDKIFDRALLIPTLEKDLDYVEQKYINQFKPKYNVKMY